MPERHPGWVTGINDFEARLATGALVTSQQTTDTTLDPLRVRSGIRDSAGNPGLVTLGTNKVTVKPFQAVIQDPARPGLGPYLVTLDAAKELPLTAADPSLARIDLVIADADPDVEPGFSVRVVEGQRSSTPQPPNVTNPFHLKLAQIQIPAGTGTPTLTDLRQFTAALGGILPVRGSADLPSAAPNSMFIYRLDTQELQVRKGSSWVTYRPPRKDTWHPVAFQNGWQNYGGGFTPAGYTMTEDGWVRLRGLVSGGATTQPITVLPTGYRPMTVHIFAAKIFGTGACGRVDVRPDGTVIGPYSGDVSATWTSLDGICFPTY
ncbi:MAG TPA: hypothetical protein VHJ83_02395 [Micromonosporaceae bacterium]|jgi:hypothetical protein|nr:hypothetical protein [Micromonosporaceae bacterium]